MIYLPGSEPDFWDPRPSSTTHRFALGRPGARPLIAIGMNPSHADETRPDRTVDVVRRASAQLGFTGWIMLNLYPERSPSPRALGAFDPALSHANCLAIESVLARFGADEVLGAWGNPPNATIRRARADVRGLLDRLAVRVTYYGALTTAGEPRHPRPRIGSWSVDGPKRYLT